MSHSPWHHGLKRRLRKLRKNQRGEQSKRRFTKALRVEPLEERALLAVVGGDALFSGSVNTVNHTSLTVGPSDELYALLANSGPDGFRFATSTDDGASWVEITAAAFDETDIGPTFNDIDVASEQDILEVDANGDFHIVFGADHNSPVTEGLAYGFYDSSMQTWTFETLATFTGGGARKPRAFDIELDSSGNPHVAFTWGNGNPSAQTELDYLFHNGTNWTDLSGNTVDGTADAFVNQTQGDTIDSVSHSNLGAVSGPDLEFDSAGNLGLSYVKNPNGANDNDDIYYATLANGGSAWNIPATAAVDANLNFNLQTSLVYDSSNVAYIAYAQGNVANGFRASDIFLADNSSSSFVATTIDTFAAGQIGVEGAHAAINGNDQIAIAVGLQPDSASPDQYRVYFESSPGTWEHEVADTATGGDALLHAPAKPIVRDDGDFIGSYNDATNFTARVPRVAHGIPDNWPAVASGPTGGVSGTELTIEGTSGNESFTITANGALIQIVNPGGITAGPGAVQVDANTITIDPSGPPALATVVINGGDGDDTLTVDYTTGNPLQGLVTTYNGGVGGDDKMFITANNGTNVIASFDNANDGDINLGSLINYTGLEPIVISGVPGDVTLTFSSVDLTETIDITSTMGGTHTLVDSSAGESIEFPNPTGTLRLETGTGDDDVNFVSFPPNYPANVVIVGQAGTDMVDVDTALSFAAGKGLSIDTENIDVQSNINTDGGDVTLTGALRILNAPTIDTETGDDGDAGDVSIVGATVDLNGNPLTINTATTGGAGGDVDIDSVDIPSLTIDSTGSSGDGVISSGGDWTLNGGLGSGTIDISGDLRLEGARTFSVSTFFGSASIDLSAATVSATAADADLALSVTPASSSISLGTFNNTGGQFIRDLSADLVGGSNLITLNNNVVTSRDQTYSDPVVLAAAINLDAEDVTFASTVDNGGNNLTVTVSGTTGEAQGAISGAGGLIKSGAGTFQLNEANPMTGNTTITAGTLAFSNVLNNNHVAASPVIEIQAGATLDVTGLASGRLDVASGQTLQGTGAVSGAVTALSGSTVAPGLSPGILSTGDFDLDSGATLNIEVDGATAGTGYDQVDVTGTVTLAGTLMTSGSFTPAGGEQFVIINNDDTDAVSGTFDGLPEGATISANFQGSGREATITYVGGDGNDVVIEVSAPTISIDDVTQVETDSGTTNFVFTVTRSDNLSAISVDYATANGTINPATAADSDYTNIPTTTLNFSNGGSLTETITVVVNGDEKVELDETFFVNLSSPVGAIITDGQGLGTITNDDAATLSIDDVTQAETDSGMTAFTFTVTLDAEVDTGVSFDFATANGVTNPATTADSDYTGISTTTRNFTSTATGATETLTVQVNGDEKVELNETFFMNLSGIAAGGRNVTFADSQGLGTITNDDAATLSIDDVTQAETDSGMTAFTFTVTLDAEVDTGVSFDFATANGATNPATTADSDYTGISTTTRNFASVTAGATETITVQVNGDEKVELDETFFLNLSGIAAGGRDVTFADSQGLGTITNDDAATLSIDDVTQAETDSGMTAFTFTVTLDAEVDTGVSFDFATANGVTNPATTADSDYTGISTTTRNFASVTAGATETITVQVNGDEKVELDETFFLNLSGIAAGGRDVTFADSQGLGTITNDDAATLSIDDVTQAETDSGMTAFTFTVTLDAEVDTGVSFDFATANGVTNPATTADSDYTGISTTTRNFASTAADATETITVQVNGDEKVELDETFFLNLSGIAAGGRDVTFADSQGLGTITNDDAATLSIDDVTQAETDSGMTAFMFTVTLDAEVDTGVSFDFATANGVTNPATTADSDYTGISTTTRNFASTAADATETITVQVNGDEKVELDETFFLNLSGIAAGGRDVTFADSQGLGTITNDDAATLSIDDVTQAETDSGMTAFMFTVTLDAEVDTGVSFDFATANGVTNPATTADNDYTGLSTTTRNFASVTAGATETITVQVNGDEKVELDETFFLNLSGIAASGRDVTFADSQGLGTITNDDAATLSIDDVTIDEGNAGDTTSFTFTVSLDAEVDTGVSFDFATADGLTNPATTADNDYTSLSTTTRNFASTAAGATEMITVQVNGDFAIEPDETFFLDLSSIAAGGRDVTFADSQGLGTILNDEVDFGDAPDPLVATAGEYPTLLANNGARHELAVGGIFLGASVDADADGQPNSAASGDDTDAGGDDEDGVTFPLLGGSLLAAGETAFVDVDASASGGLLNAWVDFNANGVWEMNEQIFTDVPLIMGTNNLEFDVPVDAAQGTTFARFRLNTSGGLMPTGLALDGEVEDYQVDIVGVDYGDAPDNGLLGIGLGDGIITGTKFEDIDGNGMGDAPLTGLLDEGGAPTGVTIELFLDRDTDGMFEPGGDDGDAVVTTITDFTTGDFLFADLPTATFFVREQPTSLTELELLQTAGGDDFLGGVNYYTVVISAGSTVSVANDFANFFEATIEGTKFEDLTNDGPSGDDTPLDSVSIQLFRDVDGDMMFEPGGDDGGPVATEFTPADGTYSFTGLGPGTYFVREDPINPGLTQTGGGDDFGGGVDYYTVVIDNSGEVVGALDFTNFISDPDARRDAVGGGGGGSMGPARDVFEPNDSILEAEVTTLSGTGSLTLQALIGDGAFGMTTGDYDFYKFSAGAGDTIDIRASELLSSGLDTFIGLYDMTGTLLASNDDASASTTDSELSFMVGPAGMYFALVFGSGSGLPADATMTGNGAGAASTGAYELTIDINAPTSGGASSGTFPTLNSSNGARHVLTPGGPLLGAAVDGEDDGQPTTAADGDDMNGDTPDDEDGVVFTSVIIPGTMATVDVTVAPGAGGLLNAWIDFNGDLAWDPTEQIFTDVSLAAGMTHTLMFSVPAGSLSADSENVYSRFRFSTEAGLMPSGLALDGEVEDYLVTLAEFDYGDAPDFVAGGGGGGIDDDGGAGGATFDYPTLAISDGARHVIVSGGPTLGPAIDADEDGQPTSLAVGDDNDADGDDEDGVVLTSALVAGSMATVNVTATGGTMSGYYLNAWIDFDRDGSWDDPGEQIFTDEHVSSGLNMLSFPVPAGAVDGVSYARFRLASMGGLSYDGQADDGEVEDYVVVIGEADYGDAPDPLNATGGEYPTLLLNSGPFHILDGTTFLGATADADLDGQPNATATGDDADLDGDDDDGVTLLTTLVVDDTVTTTASFVVDASVSGMLDAWIDFNFNGIFDHPAEHLGSGTSVPLNAGSNLLNFSVPSQTDSRLRSGETFARLRFSSTGSLLPTGLANDGEVEDYIVTVVDGDGTAAAAVDSHPVVGDVNITLSGADVVVEQDGGIVLFQAPITSIATLEFNGTAGDDTVNVLVTDAGVATTINGLAGSDTINVGSAANSLDDIQGTVDVRGDAHSAAGTLTVKSNTLQTGDQLILNDQGDADGNTYDVTSTQVNRTGAASITYGTIETLQLNSGDGSDIVTAETAASVNTVFNLGAFGDNVTISGTGANANTVVNGMDGYDIVFIQATSAGSATEFNGGSENDALMIGNTSNSLDDILGEICFNGESHAAFTTTLKSNELPWGDRLILNDQGDADGNTYDVTPTQIDRSGAASITYSTAETLKVNSGNGIDVLTVDTAPSVNTFLGTREGNDAITVTGTGANGNLTVDAGSGNDEIFIQATSAGSATRVVGGGGNDATRVGNTSNSLDDILGEICVEGLGHLADTTTLKSNSLPWGDRLILNDQGDADGNTYDVTPTQISRTGAALITYSTVETVKVNSGSGGDVMTADTAASVNTFLNSGGGNDTVTITGTGASANTSVFAGGGNDEVFVRATSAGSATEVNSGFGSDIVNIGDTNDWLAGIQGEICVNGEAHNAGSTTLTIKGEDQTLDSGDVLNINDQGTSAGLTYTLDDTTLLRSGAALITYGTIETLNLNTAQGVNDIDILTTAENANTTVTGGGDVDAVEVTTTGAGSNVIILGQAGNDTIDVTTTGAGGFVRLDGGADNDQITVNNSGAENAHVELLGDTGDDQLNVAATGTGSSTTLDGGTGVNSFYLGAGIQGDLCVIGMGTGGTSRQVRTAGGFIDTGLPFQSTSAPVENAPVNTTADDLLTLDLSTDVAGVELILDGTSLSNPGIFNIDYSGIETIDVLGGAGNDLLRVDMNLTPVVTFDGGAGTDTLGVLGTANDDNIVVGPITADPAVRAPFEIDNVECVHVEAGAGNDFVFNDTAAESLLNGDVGDDILLGGSGVDILFGHDGLDAMFGNGGDDFLFSDQAFDGTLFFNANELLNGGAGNDVGTNNTNPDILVDLETIQFPGAAVDSLNAATLTCDFTDLVSGELIAFEVPMVMINGGPLVPGLNTLTLSNGLSDAIMVLLQGTNPGSQVVTVQGQQLNTGLADALPVALAEVDANGVATVIINVPVSQLGQPLLFQAFQVLPEVQASEVITFVVGAGPLLVSGGEGPGAAAVSAAVMPALLEEAIVRWEAAGITPGQSALLRSTSVQILDLPDGMLGNSIGETLLIDPTAAGHGWFVDNTPQLSEEFPTSVAATESQAAAGGTADGQVDLLTVLMHELGHILQLPDLHEPTHDLMASMLPLGTRRFPVLDAAQVCTTGLVPVGDSDDPLAVQFRSCDTTVEAGAGEISDADSPDAQPIWQNPDEELDVNNDGAVSPLDALMTINELNAGQFLTVNGRLPGARPQHEPFLDVSGDGFISPLDAALIINELNGRAEAEGEATPNAAAATIAASNARFVQRFTTGRQEQREVRTNVSEDNANPPSTPAIVENNGRDGRSVARASMLRDSDQMADDSLESVLDEIAGDVGEQWR